MFVGIKSKCQDLAKAKLWNFTDGIDGVHIFIVCQNRLPSVYPSPSQRKMFRFNIFSKFMVILWEFLSQQTFTCSKSTIETFENVVKYVQS